MTTDSKIDRLERLNRLRESGALTQTEFEREKAKVLSGDDVDEPSASGISPIALAAAGLATILLLGALAWFLFGRSPAESESAPAAVPATVAAKPSPTPTPTATQTAEPSIISKKWLTGGWIPVGQDCQSDGGVLYHSDGTFWSGSNGGTWAVEGSNIVTVTREVVDEEGEWYNVDKPERFVERITLAKPNEYRSTGEDGRRYHNVRCPNANVK